LSFPYPNRRDNPRDATFSVIHFGEDDPEHLAIIADQLRDDCLVPAWPFAPLFERSLYLSGGNAAFRHLLDSMEREQ